VKLCLLTIRKLTREVDGEGEEEHLEILRSFCYYKLFIETIQIRNQLLPELSYETRVLWAK